MARPHPHPAATAALHHLVSPFLASSPVILHAAWITAIVAVCLALCTTHSRKPPSSSSSKASRRGATMRAALTRRRSAQAEGGDIGGGGGSSTAAAATPAAAKVSPTPSDAAKAANGRVAHTHAATAEAEGRGTVPMVTVIDVGTHGPIAPAYLFPAPDPIPPRRSLSSSVKHIRFAKRLGSRIRSSRRWGWDDHDGEGHDDDDAGGGEPGAAEGNTLWTKTIILGDRCRVGEDDNAVVRWKSYRPRQPRSVPMTRSNSFAGIGSLQGGGASRPAADDAPFYLGRRGNLPT